MADLLMRVIAGCILMAAASVVVTLVVAVLAERKERRIYRTDRR